MSIQQSYLSKKVGGNKVYDADMVTAISEKALNSQMRLFLTSSKCNWETTAYFLETMNEKGDSVLFLLQKGTDESTIPPIFELTETIENLKKQNSCIYDELEKLKLFELEPGATMENPKLAKAMEYCFSFAFHLVDGIPEEVIKYSISKNVNLDEKLQIISLNPEKKSVIFNQFFKAFEIIQLNVQMKGKTVVSRLTKVAQDCSGSNPIESLWSTRALIGVDLRATAHKEIESDEVKKKIESLAKVEDPDSVFDISQLVLNLSTLQTVSPVVIEGISPEVKGRISGFIQEYFERLEKAGQTVFGYMVQPKPEVNKVKYLFTPCSRNFDMSENVLYYLVNLSDGHNSNIPSLGNNRDFEWAPLLDNSVSADGVMAISATKFIPLIREKMEPLLPSLIMTKHPYVEAGFFKYEVKWDEPEIPKEQYFDIPVDSPWETHWSYTKEYNQDYQIIYAPIPVASGKICSKFSIDCLGNPGTAVINDIVYPSYNFAFHFKGWLNYGYDSQSNSGVYYDHDVLFQVAVKVNASGEIEFIRNVVDTDNAPPKIEIHGWSKFCSAGALQGTIDDMCKGMSDTINKLREVAVEKFL